MANNKKKNKKQRLSSLILLLLLTTIMMSTATYAWFTSNKTVTISTLDVHVEAQNGLQISHNAVDWKTVLQNTDITTGYGTDTNQLPSNMEPVSTAGHVDTNTGFLNMYYGVVGSREGDGAQILTADQTIEARGTQGKFIVFDTFLKVDAQTPISMTTASNVIPKDGTPDTGLKNAARVAYVIEGNLPATAPTADIRALKGATDADVKIWEPNFDVHTPDAVTVGRDLYGLTLTETGNTAVQYSGIKAPFTTTDNVELGKANATNYASFFDVVTPTYKTEVAMAGPVEVFTLEPGVTKVRIYMWIEGQDVDCENSASGSDISFNVQFTAGDVTP